MKRNLTLLILLFISFSNPSWSETKDDLVERNKFTFKKFSDVPFSGVLEGQWDGEFKDGKKVGLWSIYHDNGQVKEKGLILKISKTVIGKGFQITVGIRIKAYGKTEKEKDFGNSS